MRKHLIRLSALSVLLLSHHVLAQCDSSFTSINTIQGTAETSPLLAKQLSTRGVVTAIVYPGTKAAGIVLRAIAPDNSAAANSLFIADSNAAAQYKPGQQLQVTGTVTEVNQLTRLANINDIKLCDGQHVIAPVNVQLPVATLQQWEQLEGELVSFAQTLTVNDTYSLGRYGELMLADKRLLVPTDIMRPGKEAMALAEQQQRHTLVLDDGSIKQNPDPVRFGSNILTAQTTVRVGDTVTQVQGVILQNERGYFLFPTQQPQYHAQNPRPANPDAKPEKALRIASFNVLNYFNGSDQTPAFPTRRGADSLAEFKRQQEKTISALAALDADIIGLLEVENNGYGAQSALASLTNALNAVSKTPYRFITTSEQPGTDDIKVAMLYRPANVSIEGNAAMLLSSPFNWGSRPPLAQSFRHLASNELITVSINHFKSKGSCPKDPLSKDAEQQDGQGCWNALRTTSAKALSDWLHTNPTGIETDKHIILGDLNAYRMEDPVVTLEQQDWQYLTSKDGGQYSYVYRGRTGSLDHALASTALAKQLVQFQHWSINADEPTLLDYNVEFKSDNLQQQLHAPTPYRSSDHDPLLATFHF